MDGRDNFSSSSFIVLLMTSWSLPSYRPRYFSNITMLSWLSKSRSYYLYDVTVLYLALWGPIACTGYELQQQSSIISISSIFLKDLLKIISFFSMYQRNDLIGILGRRSFQEWKRSCLRRESHLLTY